MCVGGRACRGRPGRPVEPADRGNHRRYGGSRAGGGQECDDERDESGASGRKRQRTPGETKELGPRRGHRKDGVTEGGKGRSGGPLPGQARQEADHTRPKSMWPRMTNGSCFCMKPIEHGTLSEVNRLSLCERRARSGGLDSRPACARTIKGCVRPRLMCERRTARAVLRDAVRVRTAAARSAPLPVSPAGRGARSGPPAGAAPCRRAAGDALALLGAALSSATTPVARPASRPSHLSSACAVGWRHAARGAPGRRGASC